MKDSDFKKSVIKKEVTFTNGVCIDCWLQIKKKMDDFGNIHIVSYSVLIVLSTSVSGVIKETESGKKLKQQKKADEDQLDIEFPNQ
jgi:hypothetical protein